MGVMLASLQSLGKYPVFRDLLNIEAKPGANTSAQRFNIMFGIKSGPIALFTSTFFNKLFTPSGVTDRLSLGAFLFSQRIQPIQRFQPIGISF